MHLEANDREDTPRIDGPDTEITLGTGKMLVLFFGLVVLCSAFFGLGYKLGHASGGDSLPPTTSASNVLTTKPVTKPATNPTDSNSSKSAAPDNPPASSAPDNSASKPADTTQSASTQAADPTAAPAASSNYFVQVAAVTKQEDADALVDALKKKQYTAFSTTLNDKLIHIQVGPFTDIKEAEATRAKLVGDGYNPILKK